MYTKEQYEEAIKLRKQGFTYLEIAKKLNLKTINAVRGWTTKGQLPQGRFLNPNFNRLSIELAYILGVIEGDGYIELKETKGHIGLTVKDKDFAQFFKKQLEKWAKVPVYFRQRKNTKHYVTTLYSLRAARFLNNFDIISIKECNNKIKSSFLKGFFDAEGGVSGSNLNTPKTATRFISVFNSNKKLIFFMKNLIESLGIRIQNIDHRTGTGFNKKGINYRIRIGGKENLEKFRDKVGFSIKRKNLKLKDVLESYTYNWWNPEERKTAIKMSKDNRYRNQQGKINNVLIAEYLNKIFHKNIPIRNHRSVSSFIRREKIKRF